MKKAVLAFVSGVMMVSCQSDFESKSISAVKSELLDPNSFELIKYDLDTNTLHWWLKLQVQIDSLDVDLDQQRVAIWEDSKNSYGKTYYEEAVTDLNKAKRSLDSNSALLKSSPDTIVGYSAKVRYYANSRGGQRVINEMRVSFNHKGFITGTAELDN